VGHGRFILCPVGFGCDAFVMCPDMTGGHERILITNKQIKTIIYSFFVTLNVYPQ
jgi:hypothetical protein